MQSENSERKVDKDNWWRLQRTRITECGINEENGLSYVESMAMIKKLKRFI